MASVVALVPVYNPGVLLPGVLRACSALPELLVVNDGSTDETAAVLAASQIPTITHPENRGKGTALRTGFAALLARPDVTGVLTLDGDGQHDPAEAPRFFAEHARDPRALILGNRWHGSQRAPGLRGVANACSTWLIRRLSGLPILDSQSGYRLYPRSFLERALPLLADRGHFETETELLFLAARMGVPVQSVPITTQYTEEITRHSHWRAVRDSSRIARILSRNLRFRLTGTWTLSL